MKKEFVAPVTPTTQPDWLTIATSICLKCDIEHNGKQVLPGELAKFMSDIAEQAGVAPTPPMDPRAMKWISVEERCPRPNCPVLFWTTSETFESGYFRADYHEPIRWECERTGPQDERIDFFEGQVTHWMIPAAPGSTPRCGKNMGNDLLVIPCDLAAGHEGPCERNVWPVAPGSTSGPTDKISELATKYTNRAATESGPDEESFIRIEDGDLHGLFQEFGLELSGGDEVEGGATPQPTKPCSVNPATGRCVMCGRNAWQRDKFGPGCPHQPGAAPLMEQSPHRKWKTIRHKSEAEQSQSKK